MEADERVEVTVKVKVPGEANQWLVSENEGFDLSWEHADATRFDSMEEAFAVVEDLRGEWPDATMSVLEEGWSGDWPEGAVSPAAIWRHQ